jgi:hypothetical protein
MSNILFNNIPMDEFFSDRKKRKTPLELKIIDLFLLSEKEAKDLSELIIDISKQPRHPSIFPLKLERNLLSKRN